MRTFFRNTKCLVILSLLLSFQATNLFAQSGKRIIVKSGYSGSSTDTTATIKAAADAAVSRDTIIVLEGTFKEKFAITGGKEKIVMGSLFLLDGDASHISKTIISGSGVTQNSKNDVLVGFYTNTYDTAAFKFIGFTIDSAAKWAMDARGGLVSDCIFKNSGSLQTLPFYFQATRLRNLRVYNNIGGAIIHFQGYGLQNTASANSYSNIENSIFYRNKAIAQTNVDYQASVWPGWGAIVAYQGDTKGKIINSIFYNNSGDNLFNYGGGYFTDTIDIINNVIYKNNTRTATFRSWEGDNGRENGISRWYNNIIDNNYKLATESNNSEFRWGGDRPRIYELRNNIFAEPINTDGQTGFRSGYTWDHKDSIISTVTFVDTANLDFTLRDNNPGFGGGKSASFVPTDDFKGNSRPNPSGSNVDIGAIETPLFAPLPQITSLQNALISSKRSIKVNFKVLNLPAIDSIIIYRSISRDTATILLNPIDTIKFTSSEQPTYVDTNAIQDNKKYYYLIKTFFPNKLKSDASVIDSISTPTTQSAVSTPTNLKLVTSGRSSIRLSWASANRVATATSTTPYIDIYRGQNITDAKLLVSLRDIEADSAYTDKTTVPETKYVYYLVNRDINGVVSDTSANKSITTTGASPLRFYVDAVNGNDNNAGTAENTAYKTLSFAFTQAVKGDTVIALRGTYNEKFKIVPGTVLGSKYLIDNTDTASRRLTILSASGLNGSMITFSAQQNDPQSRRTKIIGLHLKNAAGSGKFIFTSDGFWGNYITFDNCYFTNNGPANLQYVDGRNPDQDIIYASFNDSTVITNSIFEYNNGRFDVNGQDIVISKNIFRYNNNSFERPNGHWIGYGVFRGWVRNKTIISDNIFMFNGKSYTDQWQDDQYAIVSLGGNIADSIFYINNTFYKNQFIALQFNNQNPTTHIVNNIFFKNGSRRVKDFQLRSTSPTGKFYFQNNSFTYDPSVDADIANLDATVVNNLFDNNLLLSDSTDLLTLDPSSGLINAGRNNYGTNGSSAVSNKDLYGTSRPSPAGSNVDIGAVESEYGFPSPYLISADGGDKIVSLKWRKPTNSTITGYEVFRSTSSIPANTNSGAVFTINVADSLNITDTGKVNLTRYYYRVRAFSGTTTKVYSGLSNELSVKPNVPPTGIDTVFAFSGPRNVAVRWKDTSSVKRKYNVYRGVNSSNLEKIASAVDTTYYVDKTVSANTKYFFAVSVVDSVGASSIISKAAFATPTNIWSIDTSGNAINNGSSTLPYKSIQEAIDNALQGDTILLNDGAYYENLLLAKKSIVLMAKNKGKVTIQSPSTSAPLFTVRDENPWNVSSFDKPKNKIIGIRFTGSSRTQWDNNGPNTAIFFTQNSDPYFEACQFVNNSSVELFWIDNSAPTFVNCIVANNNNSSGLFGGWGDSSYARTKVTRFINSTITNNSLLQINNLNDKTIVFFNSILSENGYDNRFNVKIFRAIGSIVDNTKFVTQSATNTYKDPQFNNPSASDFSLSNTSPAMGKMVDQYILVGANGSDTLRAINYDYNNTSRPQPVGTKGDAGAFESKFSTPSPLITRLQRTGTNVTLTWEKTDTTVTFESIKVYRDTLRSALDTVAALNLTPSASSGSITDVLPNTKEHFYAIRAVVGSVNTGLSNIKSSLDTIFIPTINFGTDTASIAVRGTCRNCGNSTAQVHLVNSGSVTATGYLPKLVMYSQRMRLVDSTGGVGTPEDSLLVLNLTKGSGANSIKFGLNKYSSIAKGKSDYMHIVGVMNVNGDDEFDFVTYFRKNGDDDGKTRLAYLINNNYNFRIDTANVPKSFNEQNYNFQSTSNLTYRWTQKQFRSWDWATGSVGNNIPFASEYMDGNFDGKEEVVASLWQVKWEPGPNINFDYPGRIYDVNSGLKPVKFMDVNNDGIIDIFAMGTCPGCIGLGSVNGNPLVAFVSSKKDGKFFMYNTGLYIDWGANLEFGDFMNNRQIQVLTRAWGGNYRVYEFDKDFSFISSKFQINAQLNDSKITIDDINNDSYPDVVTVDNSGRIIAYVNNHQYEFVKKIVGTIPFNSNNLWSLYSLRLMDLNQDGFKDLLWLENASNDGNWQSTDYVVRAWLQTKGADENKRIAPSKIAADAMVASNNGYKVKLKWTPVKDNIDPYVFANVKVDTLASFATARINSGYNYRKSEPTVPIIIDKVAARNFPDSLEFNDVNLNSKKPYYIALQMVNKSGQSSDYQQILYAPTDPLQSIDNAIPGLYDARFAWGDYNNDGLLDLAVLGTNDDQGNITKIYENKGGSFQDLNLANRGFRKGDIKWVDLNNDGWLDVAMIGQPGNTGVGFQMLLNNKGVFEVVTPTSVNGLKNSSLAFGDYDNNGTLDMFTTGLDAVNNPRSYVYKNDGRGNFTLDPEFNANGGLLSGGFPNLYNADARFVDWDLDGDLDLLYAGTVEGNNPDGGIRVNTLLDPKISTNNYGNGSYNGGYTYGMGMYLKNARFDIGDIDGDGDIDVAAIGTGKVNNNDVPQLNILRNMTIENKNAKFGNYFYYGNIFSTQVLQLDSINNGDVKLVDFNNDGLLDITVTGLDSKATPVTKFYLNEGGFGNFTLTQNTTIPQLQNSAISWGDADGDGSMDLVISGNKSVGSTTGIYLNKQGDNTNAAPNAPKNLRFIDQGQGRVLLLWDAAQDDKTRPANMYYNLKLGTQNGKSDLRVIQVNPTTEQLQTPNTSLIQSNQYYLELPPGAYYWSVQAVDGNYSSSKFAPTQKIVLKYPWQFVNQGGIVDTRIQPLEKAAFAWADVNNKGLFDFLYLGIPTQNTFGGNQAIGLYRNVGGKFLKLRNDSTQSTLAGTGTGFNNEFDNIVDAQIKWVDINNDGLVDLTVAGTDGGSSKGRFRVFLNRGNYKFANITNLIYSGQYLSTPKIEYIDLDNNGYKDLIYTGVDDQTGLGVFKFIGLSKDTTRYIIGPGTLSQAPPTATGGSVVIGVKSVVIKNNLESLLSGISDVNLSFGDMNKDLKPDLAILYAADNGSRRGEVYMNVSDTSLSEIKFQKNTSISLPALRNATLDLIDYNGDGQMDLSLSGTSSSTGQVFRIYQNKWLDSTAKTIQFVQTNSDVKAFENGQTTWGDIDSDGYPDIIFSGTRTGVGPIAAMALADPSTALTNGIVRYKELPTFPFGNYTVLRPSLGDFQGRRVLDVVLVGTEKVIDPQNGNSSLVTSFKILKNVRDLSARVVDTAALISKKIMPKDIVASSRVKFVGEPGSLVSGINADSTIAIADSNYVDGTYSGNNPPTPPMIDSSKIISQVGSQFLVQLSWKAAKDDHTPSSGLTYAVSIGTKPNSTDVMDPNASLETGSRKTPVEGNSGTNTSITTLLAPGTYYWTVQAIDAAKTGSKFAGFKTISVSSDRKVTERYAPYDILLNDSTGSSYFMKANDSAGFSYKIKGLSTDTTVTMRYTIVSDAQVSSDPIFRIDTAKNLLLLKSQPTASAYRVKLRATDNFGAYYEKAYTFNVSAAPSKILVNEKDTSFLYYRSSAALARKYSISLKGQYTTTPATDPILTYSFVNDKDGTGNSVFELANTVLINKRNLNDADTLKLKVQVADQNGLTATRIINLINLDCSKKATFSVKSSAVACLPDLVNLKDSSITAGSAAGLKYTYFSDAGVTAVADPTKVGTSGTYYIAAADSAGCATYKPIAVTVASKPAVPDISAANVCQNTTAPLKLTYTAPNKNVRLVWYGSNATGGTASTATPSLNTSAAGTQTLYVAQADTVAGCFSDRVKLDVKVLPAPAAATISREADGSLLSSVTTVGLKWYWYKDNVLVDSTTSKYKPTSAGNYTVKVAENGCLSASSANYYYLVNAVVNLTGGQYIRMSPNPFLGNVNFDYSVNGYKKLNVTVIENATGRVVATKKDVYAGTKMSFGNLPAGIYIIRVTSADGKFRQQFKVVKQQY